MDERLEAILERCYAFICDGVEPDLEDLCREAPELRPRVQRMLDLERTTLRRCLPDPEHRRRVHAMPQRVGDFTLIEPIGVGGMSTVYRARQDGLGREVALKVLRSDLCASATSRLRFTREASIMASLEHPHIVPVFAAGEDAGHVFLAMKLLRGRSLDQPTAPLTPSAVARIGVEVASALAAAHEVGVVHRDVKPANVVLEQGRAYVVDFGLAAFVHHGSLLTQADATPGTLIYLPPEVASRRAPALDARADVYGLGATLYELLAGRPPFDADNPIRALQQIVSTPPRPLGLARADRDLEVLVLRAMEKTPARRFQTAEEFGEELQRYLDRRPILTRPPHLLRRLQLRISSHPLVSALCACILVLLLAVVAQWLWQRDAARRSLDLGIAAATAAIEAGHLREAQHELETLRSTSGGAAHHERLRRRWHAERDLQLCTLALGDPMASDLPGYLPALVERLVAQFPPADRPASCRAVLAAAAREPQLLAADLAKTFPRTTAAVDGAQTEAAVRRRLAGATNSDASPALDHVLAAAVLRRVGAAELEVERELRLGPAGPRSPVQLHNLAISLEAQGRYREAFETELQLLADPVCGPFARWALARLAATLGEPEQAQRLRVAASATDDEDDPLLLELAFPSELQVLSTTDTDAFWRRWQAAPERCRRLPQYWLMAGYVAAEEALDEAGLTAARRHLEAGLQLEPDRLQRTNLEVALCQVEWAELAMQLEGQVGGRMPSTLRERMLELAARADRVARDQKPGGTTAVAADALVVAAQCYAEAGDWPAAATRFDRAAGADAPEGDLVHAVYIAQFVAAESAGGGALQSPDPWHLQVGATLAVERCRRLLGPTATRHRLTADDRATATAALLVCSAYLGDSATATPLALAWFGGTDALPATLAELTEQLCRSGGVLLATPARGTRGLDGRLGAAVEALQVAARDGSAEPARIRSILAEWRSEAAFERVIAQPAQANLRDAVEALESSLPR